MIMKRGQKKETSTPSPQVYSPAREKTLDQFDAKKGSVSLKSKDLRTSPLADAEAAAAHVPSPDHYKSVDLFRYKASKSSLPALKESTRRLDSIKKSDEKDFGNPV